MILGFDTSNYTTSVAYTQELNGENFSRLLPVKEGELGLRQSDAVFHHVRALPQLVEQLFEAQKGEIAAIGASTRPRRVEESYMPCFLVGESVGRSLAASHQVPFYRFSHQEGHIAAALWSANRMDLMEQPHLAWHLSGGTTELLLVTREGAHFTAQIIGGTKDISAGQLIDRTGKRLGLAFPAGIALDALAQEFKGTDKSVKGGELFFSLSGMENRMNALADSGAAACEVASFVLSVVLRFIETATRLAQEAYPGLPIVFSGGVSSNSRLRAHFTDAIFCAPAFSRDNAMGIAVLTQLALQMGAVE